MTKTRVKSILSSVILGALSPLAMAMPASAAGVEWIGSTDDNYSTNANWDGGSYPSGLATAGFPASATNQTVVNDLVSVSLVNIIFDGENPGTSSKSYTISGNPFTLSNGIYAEMTGSGGDHQVQTDITLSADQTFETSGSNTLTVGAEGTTLDLDTNDLTLNASGGTITLLGSIEGSGNIVKAGSGKVKIIADAGDGYTGGLSLPEGETSVDDNLGLPVTISGGTLKGTGTVGDVTMSSGTVAPGASPGVLNTGDLDYSGGNFDVELGGTAAGEFDQTNVTGSVDLGTSTSLNISLFGGYEPAVNDAFVIINNDGEDAVVGNFDGIENGDKVYGDYTYQINYDAGDGNDVVLLVTGNPEAPDTGASTLLSSPFATIFSALAVVGVVVAVKYSDGRASSKR